MTAVEDLDVWQKKTIGLTESAELVSLEKNAQYAIAVAAKTSAVSVYFKSNATLRNFTSLES